MTADSATLAGRSAAEALMVDTCTITRASGGTGTFNETTMTYSGGTPTSVYTGACRVQLPITEGNTPEAGERVAVVQRLTVSVPMTVTTVAVDDVVTVTSSALDDALTGRVYRVRATFAKTHATARRLICEEAQA